MIKGKNPLFTIKWREIIKCMTLKGNNLSIYMYNQGKETTVYYTIKGNNPINDFIGK